MSHICDTPPQSNLPKSVSATVVGQLTGSLQDAITLKLTWTDFAGNTGSVIVNKANPNFTQTFNASKFGEKMEVRYEAERIDGDLSALKGPWGCIVGTTVYIDGDERDHWTYTENESHTEMYLSNPAMDPLHQDYLKLLLAGVNVPQKYVITVSESGVDCKTVDLE